MKNWQKLVISLALPQLAGGLGAIFTAPAIEGWYAQLTKPAFTPPSWLFAPAWTLLYLLMGLAFFLVWREVKPGWQKAARLFFVQLGLNTLWSILFFGFQSPVLALAEILVLLVFIGITAYHFYRLDRWAGWLILPYLAWSTFATLLNAAIVYLN